MYISKGKIVGIIIGIIVAWVVIMNLGWYIWQNSTYSQYKVKGKETNDSSWIAPTYSYTDKEGYTYLVKYPNYLSLTGNLAVSLPDDENSSGYVDSLVIWPKTNGEYQYGVIIYEKDKDDETRLIAVQLEINKDGSETNEEHKELLDRHRDNINNLIKKANEYWTMLK